MGETRSIDDDLRIVDAVLDEVLREEAGPEVVGLVAAFCERCERMRSQGDERAAQEVENLARSLPLEVAIDVVRALGLHFQLLNLLEDIDRVRRLRAMAFEGAPAPESLEGTFLAFARRGLDVHEAMGLLSQLDVEFVFTAHPTEPKRRTVLERLRRIQAGLYRLERERLTPPEQDEVIATLKRECRGLWQSDELRYRKPLVADEIRMGLYFFDHVVVDLIPRFYRELRRALEVAYGPDVPRPPTFLRFGSWRGSDMDGNPNVTPASIREAARAQRTFLLRRYVRLLDDLVDTLTQSGRHVPPSRALWSSLERDAGPIRGHGG